MNSEQPGILVNGKPTELAPGTPLGELLERLGVAGPGTAVEVDGRIVPAADYGQVKLQPGQRVEIVRLVGGG
ncbi:MAG: thiamine biosynthesis protein ThiS [Deltaproteobacteria bacterium]|nr:MAG: thiamine biosynthesis protein ThiS [Deltaproteobacteria bacterium]